MFGHLQTIMIILYTLFSSVDLIDPEKSNFITVVALVDVCPENEHDVIEASKRLGCGNDTYGNNQYMCIPNKEKTSLVEFCFQGVMGILEKGNCIEFSEGKLIRHSCKQFLYGCPEFGYYDIYKYPACQNISTELQCYVMDPDCKATLNIKDSSGQLNVISTIIIVGSVFVICCVIIMLYCKRRRASRNKSKYDDKEVTENSKTLLAENKDTDNIADKKNTPSSDTVMCCPRSFKLPIDMEKETVETLLHRLEMDECKEEFQKQDLSVALLLGLSENELINTLGKINLRLDKQIKICQEIKVMKSRINSWKGKEIRLVLIGRTGSGKSATANTILGETLFNSSLLWSSDRNECEQRSAIRFDQDILVVKTPGIFDTKQTNMNIQQEISKCISFSSPGPHAFILVLSISRNLEEDLNCIQHFVDSFGESIFKYFIVLFTRKDDLDYEERSLEDYIKNVPQILQTFIEKCGQRVIAFNNRLKGDQRDEQVKNLLSMIINNAEKNNSEWYTNKMHLYREAKKHFQEREAETLNPKRMEQYIELQGTRQTIEDIRNDVLTTRDEHRPESCLVM